MKVQPNQSSVQPICPHCQYGARRPDSGTLELIIACENCGGSYLCRVQTDGHKYIYRTAPTTLPEESIDPDHRLKSTVVNNAPQRKPDQKIQVQFKDRDSDFLSKNAPANSSATDRISNQKQSLSSSHQEKTKQPVIAPAAANPRATTDSSKQAAQSVVAQLNRPPTKAKELNELELKLVTYIKEKLRDYKEAKRLRSSFFIGFYLLSAMGVFISYYYLNKPAIALGFCIWSLGAACNYFFIAGFFNTHENVIFSRTKRLWDQSTIVDKLYILALGCGIIWTLFEYQLLTVAAIFWALSIGFGLLMALSMDHQVRATRFKVVRTLFRAMDNLKYKKYYCDNLRVALCRYTGRNWYELYEYMFGYDETLIVRKELSDAGHEIPYKKWRHLFTGWIDERITRKDHYDLDDNPELKAVIEERGPAQVPHQNATPKISQQAQIDTGKLKILISKMEHQSPEMTEADINQNSQQIVSELLRVQQSLLASQLSHDDKKSADIAIPAELLHAGLRANAMRQDADISKDKQLSNTQAASPKSSPVNGGGEEKKESVRKRFHTQLIEYIKAAVIPELKVTEKDRPAPKKSSFQIDSNITQLVCGGMRLISFGLGAAMIYLSYQWLKQNNLGSPTKLLDYFSDKGLAQPLELFNQWHLPVFLSNWVPHALSGIHTALAGIALISASVISPFFRACILLILSIIVLMVGSSMSWTG